MSNFAADLLKQGTMRQVTYLYIIGLVAVLAACTGCGNGSTGGPQPTERPFDEERAMSYMAHEPERALQMIDSAETAGSLTDFRADMLRARVYCRTYDSPRIDSAIVIGERLMQHDSIKADYDIRQDVLEILQDAYRTERDYEEALRWSVQLSDLFREHGMEMGLLRNDVEIGALLFRLGQEQEGLARLDSVADILKGTRDVQSMDVAIIALKRKAEVCCEAERYADVIPVAQQMLDLLDDFEQHANEFSASTTLPAEQYPGYIDFYRSKAYAYLAAAQKSREYLALYDKTDAGQTFQGRFMIAPTLGRIGLYDRMLSIYDEAERQLGNDTLNANYAQILRDRAEAAGAQGRHTAAADYWQRYAYLQEQLSDTLLAGKAHLFAARYHAQEQQREIERQKSGRRTATLIGVGTTICCVLTLLFAAYAIRQRRKTERKNSVLVGQISEAIDYKKKYEALKYPSQPPAGASEASGLLGQPDQPQPAADPLADDNALFEQLSGAIIRERMYLDPHFGRQTLADRFGISNQRIGAAFAQGSPHASLPSYISELRLGYSCQLLHDRPDMTIDEVAVASGFTNYAVYARSFKKRYDVTPTEYRSMKPST